MEIEMVRYCEGMKKISEINKEQWLQRIEGMGLPPVVRIGMRNQC